MHAKNLKTALPWILLLLTAPAWATDHHITVGGATSGGDPYYGGGSTPILMFNPANLTITAGDTVTFTSAGGAPHNVTADDGSFRCANGCDGDGGDGTPSDTHWSATVTFDQPGSVGYHCEVHGMEGMVGHITVEAAETPPPADDGNVPITGGFTGAWFDPAQSGHGLLLEVLRDDNLQKNVVQAFWFTFTPTGEQAWFGGTGLVDDASNTAVVTVAQTSGGQWIPNFDPGSIVQVPWGTLTFSFSDCNTGRVDFNSTVSGYGSGHMDLKRLSQPIGATCP
jgi:plastocyanin